MSSVAKTRILFVDDEPAVLQVLQLALESMSGEWEMVFVKSGEEALARMGRQPFDVVVSDMRMPAMNGAQLLNEVWKRYPATARLILSGFADEDLVMRCVGSTHQFLQKPFHLNGLKATLQRIYQLRHRVRSEEILALVTRKGTLPSVPAVYLQILEALQDPDCPVVQIAEIVAQDPGLTGKILQLVNSAFFGYASEVSNAYEAVMLLGVGTIRSLALSLHVFSAFQPKAGEGFSVERIWSHSLRVGVLAKKIIELEQGDQKLTEQAFTAGMMHDVGKLILAENLSEVYLQLTADAQRQKRQLIDAEKEILHATHAEAGAYLLDLWGLPTPLVEAIALHHEPAQTNDLEFSPLTAVHVANVLEHETGTQDPAAVLSQIDLDYLGKIGKAEHLEFWRKELRETT